jgi:hypothetical protein
MTICSMPRYGVPQGCPMGKRLEAGLGYGLYYCAQYAR